MLSSTRASDQGGRWFGKYRGTVTDNADPAKLGRIWVTVPAVFGSVSAGQGGQPGQPPGDGPAVRATPCLPYGHFFVPPVGAKVWVEFEGGHVDSPIWVGVWYPDGTVPAPASIAPPDNRVIHTASGHAIEVSDKSGDEHILVKHRGASFVSVDKDGNITIATHTGSFVSLSVTDDNVTVMDKNANALTLKPEGATLVSKGGAFIHLSEDTAHVLAPHVVVEAQSVALGKGLPSELEPTFKATTFFASIFSAHTHPSAMGPTGPPIPLPIPPTQFTTSAVVVK